MKLAFTLGAAAALISFSAVGAGTAVAKNTIEIDQGTVKVAFNPNVSGHSIGYKLPKGCEKTKVDVKETDGAVTISHSGPACLEGASFTLILGDRYQTEPLAITLKAGVLQLPAEMKHYNKADIKVTAGAVDSRNLSGYCARKFPNPAGVSCSFKAATEAKDRYDVTARVKAGVVRM